MNQGGDGDERREGKPTETRWTRRWQSQGLDFTANRVADRRKREERLGACRSLSLSKSCVGYVAMEFHGDRLPGRYISTGGQQRDVSYDEAREGVSRARRRPAVDGKLRPAQGGAEDTEEPVLAMRHGMASLLTSSRDKLWRAMLLCLSRPVEKAGYMVKSMRLISTNKGRSGLLGKVRLRVACRDQERGQSGQSGQSGEKTQ